MSEKRFERWNDHSCKAKDNQEDTFLNWEGVVNKLNEKEAIIQRLELENENLRKQVESSETTSNATSHYNAFLESKITTLEKENEQLKQKLENIGLNEKNDMIKMIDGKVFIRM